MDAKINLLDSRFNYPYKGFCSIVCAVIDIALEHYFVNKNLNCYISDSQILELFDNICISNQNSYDASSWWLERFFGNQLYYSEYNAHTIANVENLKIKNKVLNSVLKIKEDKEKKFKQKFIDFGITDKTLGIQIRGTDKKTEVPEPNFDTIIKKIDNKFDSLDIHSIFLATDDTKYLNLLKERYGDLVVYDNTIHISLDGIPLHRSDNRKLVNEEVLSNVYILSKCCHFMYSFSNVSLLALIMGANNHQTISNINQ